MGFYTGTWQVSLALAVLCAAVGVGAAGLGHLGHRAGHPAGHHAGHHPDGLPDGHLDGHPAGGRRCGPDAYWDAPRQKCVPCTRCSGPGQEVTVRPCQSHKDTLCGSLKDLRIDWSWTPGHQHDQHDPTRGKDDPLPLALPLGWQKELEQHRLPARDLADDLGLGPDHAIDFGDDYILPSDLRARTKQVHHGKKHQKPAHRGHPRPPPDDDEDLDDGDYDSSGDREREDDEDVPLTRTVGLQRFHQEHHHEHHGATSQLPTTESTPSPLTSTTTEAVLAFSAAESLVWDWQAGVLAAAVFACLLFFLVAAAYSCHHAWHFRTIKRHLHQDMEELSARLALMSGTEHLQDPSDPPALSTAASGKNADPPGPRMNEYSLSVIPRRTRV